MDQGFDAPELQVGTRGDRERWFIQENRPSHAPESPFLNPVTQHPSLARSIARVAVEARRLGIGVTAVHYAIAYAYLTANLEDGEDG